MVVGVVFSSSSPATISGMVVVISSVVVVVVGASVMIVVVVAASVVVVVASSVVVVVVGASVVGDVGAVGQVTTFSSAIHTFEKALLLLNVTLFLDISTLTVPSIFELPGCSNSRFLFSPEIHLVIVAFCAPPVKGRFFLINVFASSLNSFKDHSVYADNVR